MLDEVNPKLYELCEAAVSQIIDRFVSSLEKKFSEMAVSDKMKSACQGYTDFLARKVEYCGLENVGTVYSRAVEMVKNGLGALSSAERFALACFYIEQSEQVDEDEDIPAEVNLNELPTDDEIAEFVVEVWSDALFDRYSMEEQQEFAALDVNEVVAKPANCPFCGGNIVPIIYGEPNEETFEKAEKGEVKLGGCCLSGADPQWACAECGQEFLQK